MLATRLALKAFPRRSHRIQFLPNKILKHRHFCKPIEPPANKASTGPPGPESAEVNLNLSISNENLSISNPETENIRLPHKSEDDATKIDKRAWPIALSTFIMGTAIYAIIPTLPLFVESLGLTTTDFGLVVSVMGVSRLVMNIPVSLFADIYGRRPLLIWGPIGTMIAMIGHGVSKTMTELLSWRVLTGVSSSAQMAGGNLYLADISTPANRARTLAPMAAAWSAGATLGPAIGGLMADWWGLQAPFFFVAGCVALIAVNNWRLPETLPVELQEKAKYRTETWAASIISKTKDVMRQWKELLKNANVQSAVLMHTTFWFALSASQFTLLPMLAIQMFGCSATSLGSLFCLISVINVVGSHPSALWSDKMGRKMAIVPGALIVAAVIALIPFCATFTQFVSLIVVWGIGASLTGTAPTAYVTDITEPQSRAQALALLRSGGDFGLLFGALIGGAAATSFGIPPVMVLNAAVLAGAVLSFAMRAEESCGYRVIARKNK